MTNGELEKVGCKVIELIKRRSFDEISSEYEYEYAMSMGREAEAAIKSDFDAAVKECVGTVDNAKASISISHFKPNETGLKSLIKCDLLLENSTGILVELILSIKGSIYLEDISSYRGPLNA